MNDFEMISLSASSSSEMEPRLVYPISTCSACGAHPTKELQEGVELVRVLAPCACWPSDRKLCDPCLRKLIENSGSLCCPFCSASYTLEAKVGCGRWNAKQVNRRMQLRGVIEVFVLLILLHVLVIPSAYGLHRAFDIIPWWGALLICYAIVFITGGAFLYAYYAIQMFRHRTSCMCSSCRLGNTPLLTYRSDCTLLYAAFLIATPPMLWLFFIVVIAALLNRRARQYYARQCMRKFIIRCIQ